MLCKEPLVSKLFKIDKLTDDKSNLTSSRINCAPEDCLPVDCSPMGDCAPKECYPTYDANHSESESSSP